MMDSTTRAIDPHGDVLAILPTTGTKLRVSSKVLSVASPVFRSMFSPRFREGAALASATGLIQIEFPEEPPQALETIFNLLHYRHDCVRANVSYDLLYEIALVVDKYDLARALGPWKEVWMRRGAGDGGRGLFAMYVFGDREGFKKGCRRAIMQDRGYGRDDDHDDDGNDGEGDEKKGEKEKVGERESGWDCDALPEKVIELISTSRISTIRSLLSVAEYFRNLYQSPDIKCRIRKPKSFWNTSNQACDAAILGSLVRHEAAIGIFPVPLPPFQGISVESLALAMKGLRCFVDFDAGHGGCMVVGEMVRRIEEVVAGVDKLDIWDCSWGQSIEDADA